jgi:hypothetical protein
MAHEQLGVTLACLKGKDAWHCTFGEYLGHEI